MKTNSSQNYYLWLQLLTAVGVIVLPANFALADDLPQNQTVTVSPQPPLGQGGLGGSQHQQQELADFEFLAPIPGQVFDGENQTVNIAVQYPKNVNIELKINEVSVTQNLLKKIEHSSDGEIIINNWEGVTIQPGENIITATATGKDGQVFTPISVTVLQEEIALETNNNNQAISEPTETNVVTTEQNNLDKPLQILSPQPQQVFNTPATSVVAKYPQGATLQLSVNGVLVNDQESLGRVEMDPSNGLYINSWYGLGLQEGENTITLKATLPDGTELPPESVTVTLSGQPVKLQLESLQPRIPADGRSQSIIRGRLLDKNGQVANWDSVVTLNTSGGRFIGEDLKPEQQGFQVETKQGEFEVVLQAGTQAANVNIQAKTGNFEAYTQVQLITQLRQDPIVTGVIDLRVGPRGLNYHGRYREFLPLDNDHSYKFDAYGAVFATGALGDWQYTAAFNSDRPLFDDKDVLFKDQYPVYGDNSTTEQVAKSTDQFYLRFERSRPDILDPDYFMWGSYNTNEFSTVAQDYSGISRQLNGFKGNYSFGNLQVTGFFASSDYAFQRDTIAPDGTRGDYFLSRRNLRQGSETVYFELEELNRPGTVVARERLSRGSDYKIDYDRGNIFFNDPVFQTALSEDADILVRRIVVTYDYEGREAQDNKIYGGRVRYHFGEQTQQKPSWLGGSYFLEDKDNQSFQLWSADAVISLGEKNRIVAEYAHSTNSVDGSGDVSGSAYRLEFDGNITDKINARAYYRNTDPGFTNNATTSFVPGQTRYGARLQTDVGQTTSLVVSYDHEDNFGTAPRQLINLEDLLNVNSQAIPGNQVDNSLTTISAGVRQKIGKADLNVDWIYRDRSDRLAPQALESQSHQIRSRLNIPVTDRLSFNVLNETTISSENDAVYQDRTAFGVDWRIFDGVNLSLAQQWFTSGDYAGKSITNFGINADYKIGTDTTLIGRYAMGFGGDSTNSSGAVGLKQKWTISPGLVADFGYEHTFSTFRNTNAGTQFLQPFATGQSSSALGLTGGDTYTVGISYTDNPDWKASANFEHRTSAGNSRTNLNANVTGNLTEELTIGLNYSQSSAANQGLQALDTTRTVNLGLAYRSNQLNALLKYEYRKNPALIPETLLIGVGSGSEDHVLSLEGIYTPDWRWEYFGKYAMRSSTTNLANDFTANSIVHLGQIGVTYRFAYDWDIKGEARIISQPSAGYTETGLVLDLGYYLTPELRLGVGYTLGNVDDRDFSGSRNGSGFHFGLTMKLNGLFDGFGEQKPVPPQQQSVSNPNPQPKPETPPIPETPETNEVIEKDLEEQSFINNYLANKEKLANLKKTLSFDEKLINKYAANNIINYSDMSEDEYSLLTEDEYENLRW